MEQKRYKLLIVDDDPEVRKSLRRGLRGNEFDIVEAPDGETGLTMLHAEKPDVVISDYSMPGMNGIDFLHQVRMQMPSTLRIVLTGEIDVKIAARALNEGAADRFLLKPWERVDLLGIVRIAQRAVPRAHVSGLAPKGLQK